MNKFVALVDERDPRKFGIGVFAVDLIVDMVEEEYAAGRENDKSGRYDPSFVRGVVAAVRLRKGVREKLLALFETPAETPTKTEQAVEDKVCTAKQQRPVNTYFIYSPKLEAVKIGKSINPEKRLTTIKNGNPDELRLLGIIGDDRETEFHQRFAEYRTNGEWFSLGPELVAFLKVELGYSLGPSSEAT